MFYSGAAAFECFCCLVVSQYTPSHSGVDSSGSGIARRRWRRARRSNPRDTGHIRSSRRPRLRSARTMCTSGRLPLKTSRARTACTRYCPIRRTCRRGTASLRMGRRGPQSTRRPPGRSSAGRTRPCIARPADLALRRARAREAAGGAVGARRGFVIAIFARSTGRARRAAGLGKSAGRADITRGRARARGATARAPRLAPEGVRRGHSEETDGPPEIIATGARPAAALGALPRMVRVAHTMSRLVFFS